MATLRMHSGVELHYYDDDFTDPWRSSPTILLQHGFSRNGKFWYSWVPLLAREFRVLRLMIRYRRKLVEERSRVRNRIQKLLDRNGLQLGWVLGDTFGPSGPRHFYRPS